jgi:hypothetical protein
MPRARGSTIKNFKLYLASLGVGILISVFLFLFSIFLRALFRETAFGDWLIWFYSWPAFLLARLRLGLSSVTLVVLSLAIVQLLSIGIFSFISYWILRTIQRSRRGRLDTPVPPQPPPF